LSEIAIGVSGVIGAGEETHTRRQIAIRLLPFLFLLYIVNFLDRASVAYAAIGMKHDLGFDDGVFGLGFGIFFLGYVTIQIPGTILVERWSARKMICLSMAAWGAMTGLTALVRTPSELYLARFLLGAAEASFFPGVVMYLSHWFVREDRAKATSNFMAAIPLSLVIGSPIAGWILGITWRGLPGWRWLFVVEGIPAVLMGIVAYFFLTDTPREAAWLNPGQKNWLENTLAAQRPRFQKATLWQAFRSRTVLLLGMIAFLNYAVFYSLIFWQPTILKRQSGLTDAQVGLLGAIPYLVYFVAMQINGWHSDKNCERRWHAIVPLLVAMVGMVGMIGHPSSLPLTVFLLTLIAIGNCYVTIFWVIPTEILSPSIAAGSVGLISCFGSVAGFGGPYAFGYLNKTTGSFTVGWIGLVVFALFGVIAMFRVPAAREASIREGEDLLQEAKRIKTSPL